MLFDEFKVSDPLSDLNVIDLYNCLYEHSGDPCVVIFSVLQKSEIKIKSHTSFLAMLLRDHVSPVNDIRGDESINCTALSLSQIFPPHCYPCLSVLHVIIMNCCSREALTECDLLF